MPFFEIPMIASFIIAVLIFLALPAAFLLGHYFGYHVGGKAYEEVNGPVRARLIDQNRNLIDNEKNMRERLNKIRALSDWGQP